MPVGVDTKSLGTGVDALLARFERALDAANIDIVQGNARDLDFRKDVRPRLAKLSGFPRQKGAHRKPEPRDWMNDFNRGVFGYVAAYQPPGTPSTAAAQASPTSDAFLEEWGRTRQGDRVFVAFTRQDAAAAQKVAQVLKSQGFVVFTYLRDAGASPWAAPEVVGRLFREAGHHFVVDTPDARASGGVSFEALSLARLKETTRQASPTSASSCRNIFGAL